MAEGSLETTARVLVVGGAQGKERNGVQLLEHWRRVPESLNNAGFPVAFTQGNPGAIAAAWRTLERDLSRGFAPPLLEDPHHQEVGVC